MAVFMRRRTFKRMQKCVESFRVKIGAGADVHWLFVQVKWRDIIGGSMIDYYVSVLVSFKGMLEDTLTSTSILTVADM